MLADSVAQTCFKNAGVTKRAAICFQAKAGDEDGRLVANGVTARWIKADAFNVEGIPQDIPDSQGTIGSDEGFKATPKDAWRGAKNEDGTFEDAKDVLNALDKGAKVSATWYQPSMSKNYVNTPRYNSGDTVQAFASGLAAEEESWSKFTPCMKATLTGANSLLAGAAIAFGTASLF